MGGQNHEFMSNETRRRIDRGRTMQHSIVSRGVKIHSDNNIIIPCPLKKNTHANYTHISKYIFVYVSLQKTLVFLNGFKKKNHKVYLLFTLTPPPHGRIDLLYNNIYEQVDNYTK